MEKELVRVISLENHEKKCTRCKKKQECESRNRIEKYWNEQKENGNHLARFQIFKLIDNERKRQDEKFGTQNHCQEKWITILGEEFGEVCNAVLEKNDQEYIDELIQVCAVCVSMIECFQRNKVESKSTNKELIVTLIGNSFGEICRNVYEGKNYKEMIIFLVNQLYALDRLNNE